jgi:environmental stress-induced protein Ves
MNSPDIVLVPQSSYKRMRWKNGAGWTTEIALESSDDGSFTWRVSIAEVDADCDFSLFPGIDRTLLVLSGGAIALEFDSGPVHELRPLQNPLVFPGEAVIRARLLDGPTCDFNVMTRRTLCSHTLELRRPRTSVRLTRTWQQCFLVHVLDGATCGASAGDSFIVPEGPEKTFELADDATLLVVGLRRIEK